MIDERHVASPLKRSAKMTYAAFSDKVQQTLSRYPTGLTWVELRGTAKLPYQRPCPEWTKQLENDIGLIRTDKRGNAFIWRVEHV